MSFTFGLHSAAVSDSHVPCSDHAVLLKATAWSEHGTCESDTAALCKSGGKDTFKTLSGIAWARHAMCELAFIC